MADIKPIETFYNGYRFRSRLEAKWAVFFDALDVEYEYEPEGFSFPPHNINYLPDFYLPRHNAYIEIKPCNALDVYLDETEATCTINGNTKQEGIKYSVAWQSLSNEHTFILFQGDPYDIMFQNHGGKGSAYIWCKSECVIHVLAKTSNKKVSSTCCNDCSKCDNYLHPCCFEGFSGFTKDRIIIGGEYNLLPYDSDYFFLLYIDENNKMKSLTGESRQEITDAIMKNIAASEKARQARFEHGECG